MLELNYQTWGDLNGRKESKSCARPWALELERLRLFGVHYTSRIALETSALCPCCVWGLKGQQKTGQRKYEWICHRTHTASIIKIFSGVTGFSDLNRGRPCIAHSHQRHSSRCPSLIRLSVGIFSPKGAGSQSGALLPFESKNWDRLVHRYQGNPLISTLAPFEISAFDKKQSAECVDWSDFVRCL